MKRFLIQSVLFTGLMIGLISLILFQADGYTDAFYLKFTTPSQSNLILGTSKAAQGIQPRVLKEASGKPFLNYAFTEIHSPYGPSYLRSIKRKLNQETKTGVFLLSIDPWSISAASSDPNDSTHFRELGLAVDNTDFVNLSPNFPYLIENLSGEYYTILSQRNPEFYLHKDGWLEVKLSRNSSEVDQRRKEKLAYHRKNSLPYYKFSSLRFSYLQKTIDFLQAHGRVYLIRLPIHPQMMELEEEMMPDFQAKIDLLIPEVNDYLDLTEFNADYRYIDGTHLDASSSTKMSKIIANWIEAKQNE